MAADSSCASVYDFVAGLIRQEAAQPGKETRTHDMARCRVGETGRIRQRPRRNG
jgi:hypothetical protein